MNTIVTLLLLSASGNTIDPDRVDWHLPEHLAVLSVKTTSPVKFDRAVAEWPSSPRAGSQSVRLRIEGRLDTIFAFVKLGELRSVLVATRPLKRGEVLQRSDFRRELRPAEGLDLSLVGARVQANLQSGDVISAKHVELPPPVARGTQITVVSSRGSVRVRATGQLHEACRIGERCKALTSNQRQPLPGRLVNPQTFVLETP